MTDAEFVVLSLVVERPRHGYEIEAVIVERNMREWASVGHSSIYYLLDKLQKAGLAQSVREPAPGRGPARRVYSATEEGLGAMRREALEAIVEPSRPSSSFLLGLSALPLLDEDEVADAIAVRRRDLEDRLRAVDDRKAFEASLVGSKLPFHVSAIFDLSAVKLQSELDWIRQFETEFKQQAQAAGAGSQG